MITTEIKPKAVPNTNWRDTYKSLHLWMLIPMVIMQIGIFRDYWGDFSENAWSVHVHYISGTIWYLYLIIQPWLATHGHMPKHRTNGIIGMSLAGGVCLTALSMMHRDIVSAERSALMRDRFGPFEPWFFYGVAAIEIVMMTAFGYAVIMSIIHRKKVESHAWWLISTVFIIMMPALGRGMQFIFIAMNNKNWPNVDIISPIYYSLAVIILMVLLAAWKYNKFRHPATWLAVGINLFNLLLEPLGRSETVKQFLTMMVKG
jgi:hypothetical protein